MKKAAIDLKEVESVTPNCSLKEAVKKMAFHGYSCMVVVDEAHCPVGIITERDMSRILGDFLSSEHQRNLEKIVVGEVMSSPAVTLNHDETLFEALVVGRAQNIRHLPVVEKESGRLAGLVTQSDMVRAYIHEIERQREIIEQSIKERTQELKEANEQLVALALEDALLGIGNRRAMNVDLDHTHASAVRYFRPYSTVLIDVDYFKTYNDHYGHMAGDQILQKISGQFESLLRKADRLYRYGGEEFLLLLPETPLEGAKVLAERLVDSIHGMGLIHEQSPYGKLSVSAGVSCVRPELDPKEETWEAVIERADKALYMAKSDGRNCARLGDDLDENVMTFEAHRQEKQV